MNTTISGNSQLALGAASGAVQPSQEAAAEKAAAEKAAAEKAAAEKAAAEKAAAEKAAAEKAAAEKAAAEKAAAEKAAAEKAAAEKAAPKKERHRRGPPADGGEEAREVVILTTSKLTDAEGGNGRGTWLSASVVWNWLWPVLSACCATR